MFLQSSTSKGKRYIYLFHYCLKEHTTIKKQKLYSFGRVDKALTDMISWEKDFSRFPQTLIEVGCSRADLEDWIRTIKTGVTKTGKKFKAVI